MLLRSQALEAVDRLGDLDLLALVLAELGVVGVADDDGLAGAGDDCFVALAGCTRGNGKERRGGSDLLCW